MKTHIWLGCMLAATVVGAANIRTWNTTAGGDGQDAAFLIERRGQVGLEGPDGRRFRIPLDQLNRIDQDYVALRVAGDRDAASAKLEALFGETLETATGEPVATDELANRKIAIYFSAVWCPPCRTFTPQLVEAYRQWKADEQPIEIVFVSSDRNPEAARQYMADYNMEWLMLPFDSPKRAALSEKFGVRGIPMLVVVDAAGKVLSTRARADVMKSGANAITAWP